MQGTQRVGASATPAGAHPGASTVVESVRSWYQSQRVAAAYDAERFRSLPGRLKNALDRRALGRCLAYVPAGAPVLDLACGTGRMTEFIRRRGHAVLGIDSSAAMLQVARRRLPEAVAAAGRSAARHTAAAPAPGSVTPTPFVCADAGRLPLRSATFTAVSMVRFLHLLPREARVEVLRSAAATAALVIADYTLESRLGTWRRRLTGVRGGTMAGSDAALADELAAAGLVERMRIPRLPLLSDCVYLVLERRSVAAG